MIGMVFVVAGPLGSEKSKPQFFKIAFSLWAVKGWSKSELSVLRDVFQKEMR